MLQLPPTPPSMTNLPDWCRKVAGLINQLIIRRPFPTTQPTDPQPGDGWFDVGDGKAKIWDGAAWQALW